MAEREGFEPSMEFQAPYSLSRGAPSASRPSLQKIGGRLGRANYSPARHGVPALIEVVFAVAIGRIGLTGLLTLNALVDLLAVDGNVPGGVDANPNLITLDAKYGDGDFVTDHKGLADPSREYQHFAFSPLQSITQNADQERRGAARPAQALEPRGDNHEDLDTTP